MHFVDARSILSSRNGINLYRGCTHGCIYCDSRSACYRMEHAFEDVGVKQNAPGLLERALGRKRLKGMIATGSMCDPYMPCEETLGLMRRCLEIIERNGFGVTVLTKSDLILRDLPILKRIHEKTRCVVQMTLTTADEALCRILEPNVCTTRRRYEVLKAFQREGIPAVVWLCPVLPFINDTPQNIRGVLEYCFDAGVKGVLSFGMGMTLREGSREHFYGKLDEHFPGLKQKYVQTFGLNYECPSPRQAQLQGILETECEKRGVMHRPEEIFAYLEAFPQKRQGEQLSLFDL